MFHTSAGNFGTLVRIRDRDVTSASWKARFLRMNKYLLFFSFYDIKVNMCLRRKRGNVSNLSERINLIFIVNSIDNIRRILNNAQFVLSPIYLKYSFIDRNKQTNSENIAHMVESLNSYTKKILFRSIIPSSSKIKGSPRTRNLPLIP